MILNRRCKRDGIDASPCTHVFNICEARCRAGAGLVLLARCHGSGTLSDTGMRKAPCSCAKCAPMGLKCGQRHSPPSYAWRRAATGGAASDASLAPARSRHTPHVVAWRPTKHVGRLARLVRYEHSLLVWQKWGVNQGGTSIPKLCSGCTPRRCSPAAWSDTTSLCRLVRLPLSPACSILPQARWHRELALEPGQDKTSPVSETAKPFCPGRQLHAEPVCRDRHCVPKGVVPCVASYEPVPSSVMSSMHGHVSLGICSSPQHVLVRSRVWHSHCCLSLRVTWPQSTNKRNTVLLFVHASLALHARTPGTMSKAAQRRHEAAASLS